MYNNSGKIYLLIEKFIQEKMDERITYDIIKDLDSLIKKCIEEEYK